MGDNEPEFQSLSLQVQETARWTRGLSASCKEGPLEPGGQQGRQSPQSIRAEPPAAMTREISVAWSSTLVCGARPSRQWSGACLSYTLKVVYSTLLDLLNKCLGPPDAKCRIFPGAYGWYMAVLLDSPAGQCGLFPGAYLWWSRSADMAILIT